MGTFILRRTPRPPEPVDVSASRCRACGKPVPALAARDGDPYCSVDCCRRDHGILASVPAVPEAPGAIVTIERRTRVPQDRRDARRTLSDTAGLWLPEEAAGYLRISRFAVLDLARRGKIPSVKIGRRTVRFRREALEEYARLGGERGWPSSDAGGSAGSRTPP